MNSVILCGDKLLTVSKGLLSALAKEDSVLAGKLKAALKVAKKHNIGWSIAVDEDCNIMQILPRIEDPEYVLSESEALVMAVELHHIFHNNPNVYKWPVKLGRGATAYIIRRKGQTEVVMTTIVLNSQGYYLTSYDPTKNEFFPPVHGLSTKEMQKVYPQLLDEIQNMYTVVKQEVKELREKDEADNS